MPSLNKIQVIGNVGQEPEMRFTPEGKAVTTFSLAANEYYTDAQGERHEKTEWFNIVTWNKLAETCNQFVTKGMMVYAEGRLQTRKWEGQDGQMKYRAEIVASKVLFLSKPSDEKVDTEGLWPEEETPSAEEGKAEPESPFPEEAEPEPEDVPF